MLTIPSSHGKSTVLAMVKIYPCFDVHEYSSSHTFQTLKWLKSLWFIIIPTVQTLDSVRTSSREFKCVLMMNLLVGGGGQVCCCYSLPVEIFTIIILDIPEEITASGSCCLLSTVLIDIVHLTLLHYWLQTLSLLSSEYVDQFLGAKCSSNVPNVGGWCLPGCSE